MRGSAVLLSVDPDPRSLSARQIYIYAMRAQRLSIIAAGEISLDCEL